MTIQATDIQLLASEKLTDNDDGGGKMTGNVIVSGQVNNLFDDISRLDRTYGRLSLRKAYMAVRSQTTDTYLGAHAIVAAPPADSKVAVTIFTTNSNSDVRTDAEDRIESYLTAGPTAPFYLYGTQPVGAKAIAILGHLQTPLPVIGDVYVLSVESAGVVSTQQFIRVANVNSVTTTFTDGTGDYQLNVITLTLTSALKTTYIGAEASRFNVGINPPTLLRTSIVADASTYYGITSLSEPVAANALQLQVESITAQLVPATTQEVAVAGSSIGLALSYVAAGVAQALNAGSSPRYQYTGILPGSVSTTIAGAAVTDDGDGNLVHNNVDVGTVDYQSGRLAGGTIGNGSFIPAAAYSSSAYSLAQSVTIASQGTVYAITLPSLPAPGTVEISYRYLGKWYALTDAGGTGALTGEQASTGSGRVDYTTGNVTVTLGALPDIGSKVIFSWGDATSFTMQAGSVTATTPVLVFQVQHWPIKEGTLTLSWTSGGVAKSATADASGTITGNATGKVVYLDGTIILTPAAGAYPDSTSTINAVYSQASGQSSTVNGTYAGGQINFALPASALPATPGSFSGSIAGSYNGANYTLYYQDDGSGNIVTAVKLSSKTKYYDYDGAPPAVISVQGGTIDYTTGAVQIQPGNVDVFIYTATGTTAAPDGATNAIWTEGYWTTGNGAATFVPEPVIRYSVQTESDTLTPQNESIQYPGISFCLTPTSSSPILPGSVWFTWGGKTYIDRSGTIYRDMDPTTGSATQAGTIDYLTGIVTLTNYGSSTGGAVTLVALVTQDGIKPTSYVAFRTPGSPIRSGSFYVQAVRTDTGDTISATEDGSGVISSAAMSGKVDNQMGWVELSFGTYVTAAGNETEAWYDASTIVDGNVWKPILVDPTTIQVNCVIQTALPLSAALLGIDPVRLPLNGAVPIIRDGDVIVVHDDRTMALPTGFGAGSTVTVADAPLAQCAIVDATGTAIDVTNFSADLDTGVITGSSTWDVSAYTAPYTIQYTVEDMLLATDVELTGLITVGSALSRNYPAGAKVSSALLFGDMQAANAVFFSQTTWTGAFSDTLIGSTTTAQYNDTLYPLQVTNADSYNDRWALIFTSTTGGNIVGEVLGDIGTFSTTADVAPINPITGNPYFTLKQAGFGSGWAVNNVIRFNTTSANEPIWIARTILPGAAASSADGFKVQLRGDVQ